MPSASTSRNARETQVIGVCRAVIYVAIAVTIGIMRLRGHRGEVFKDLAHLYTGGFIGAGLMGGWHQVRGWQLYAALAVGLSLLEVYCFLTGTGRP